MPNRIVAVIGSAHCKDNIKQKQQAYTLGQLIINNGYILATGGLGGVMKYASKGARESNKYVNNSIIGVLPNSDSEECNPYIDIALPVSMGVARNTLLVNISCAVIAVGGGAGTLNEMSAAWQMQKLLIGLKIKGWSQKLCGQSIDQRRKDHVFCADDAHHAISLLNEKIEQYPLQRFSGIHP